MVLLLVMVPQTTFAQLNLPFGGQIQSVLYCNCTKNFLLKIGPPRGSAFWASDFLFNPGQTIVYQFYQILRPGVWTLGTWEGGGVCVYGPLCEEIIPAKPIRMVGTSL